ncbi:MAG TPA: GNAT family N-acetyltransferase [bacterium]|nr:GNAT family N-acetyltransferase [bacterium]
MNSVRYRTPQAFLDAVEPFLLADEACHNLLLGIPARLIARGPAAAEGVYLAAAVDRGRIAGAAMMTPPWHMVLSKTAHPDAVRCIAEDAAAIRPAPAGVNALEDVAPEFVGIWRRLTGEPAQRILTERIHRLDAVRPVPDVAGRLRPADTTDRPLLVCWLQAFADEIFTGDKRRPGNAQTVVDDRLATPGEGIVLWEDSEARCVAGYGSGTKHGIRIGPVYTPPEHRNRGYATACVAALSRQLLEQGRRFCMLFTDLENPGSNRIYQRIGYEPVCDVAEYRFIR